MTMTCSTLMPSVMEHLDGKGVLHCDEKGREHCDDRVMEQFDEKCHGASW